MQLEEALKNKIADIEQIIENYLPNTMGRDGVVYEAMCYSLNAGGKRLRPIFLMEMFHIFCSNEDDRQRKIAECFATALEMVHTYSLVHDDLPAMDNDQYRRGKLTTHAKYGEAIAILAGDALLNEAFAITSEQLLQITKEACCESKEIPEQLRRAVKAQSILARCSGKDGMVKGQEIDLLSEGKLSDDATLLTMYELKTARLLEAAFTMGAVLGGCSKEQEELAYKIASALGRAFQLRDDILDLVGDVDKLGKPIHSDLKNEKSTYISFHGIEKTEAEVLKLTKEALQYLEYMPSDTTFLKELMLFLVKREY